MSDGFGVFRPDTAREILSSFQQLKSSGLLAPGVLQSLIRGRPEFTEEPKKFTNASSDIIPPYACMQIVGTETIGGQTFLQVDQPVDTTGDAGPYIFNWHYPVEQTKQGIAQKHRILRAYSTGGTVTTGDSWRPVVGSWAIESGSGPFTACGEDEPAALVHGFPVVKIEAVSAGAGVGRIEFLVTAATTVDDTASPYDGMRKLTVTVKSPSCNQPGLLGATGVLVYEHDPQCLTTGETDEALVGRKGWAFEGIFQDQSAGATAGDATPCHWVLDGLCCP